MLTNYHTHSTFCDGKDTVDEMVRHAIELGFDAIGFSGHGRTETHLHSMRDHDAYCAAVLAAREAYRDRIQVYLGVEEDMTQPVEREKFEYIIGSVHYICKDGVRYPVDSGIEHQQRCLEAFGGDSRAMAKRFFETAAGYILERKPDIVGHFDLLTKYDEQNGNLFLGDREYLAIAREYLGKALASDCIFEVNTGAMARGLRTKPYPCEELLHFMKQQGAKLILSSDCHDKHLLDAYFDETKVLLRQVGFRELYVLYDGAFRPTAL